MFTKTVLSVYFQDPSQVSLVLGLTNTPDEILADTVLVKICFIFFSIFYNSYLFLSVILEHNHDTNYV